MATSHHKRDPKGDSTSSCVRKRKSSKDRNSSENESDKQLRKKASSGAATSKSSKPMKSRRTLRLEKDRKITSTLSSEQKERLDVYMAMIYNEAKLQYSDSDVAKQKNHVENIMTALINKLQEQFPSLKIQDPLPSGSFYLGTKILSPSEFDYLVILFGSIDGVGVSLPDGNNEVQIMITEEELKLEIKRFLSNDVNQQFVHYDNFLLTNPFRYCQINPIHECLKQLNQEGVITYKGKHFLIRPIDTLKALDRLTQLIDTSVDTAHKEGYKILLQKCKEYRPDELTIPPLKLGDVVLNKSPNSPVVQLRVAGPLGPTDIDLCFCVEISRTNMGRYIAIPLSDDNFSNSINWRLSFHESPTNPRLDNHHRKILIILKYLFLECKLVSGDTFNSHKLKTCVMIHQEMCKEKSSDKDQSLGRCFNNIASDMFKLCDMTQNNEEIKIPECSRCNLKDINFPERTMSARSSWHSMLFLYTLTEVVKDSETSQDNMTQTALDHRLVLAEILAQEKGGKIYSDRSGYTFCPLKVFEVMKSKSYTVH